MVMRAREVAHNHEESKIEQVILARRPAMVDVGATSTDKTDWAETQG